MNQNHFKVLLPKGAQFRNSFEHFPHCSFDNSLLHSRPVQKLEGLKIRFLDLMSFLIKVSQPGLIAVPTFGRRNVNINLVSCVFFGCHANLLQTFIRVIGKDAGLIFDGKIKQVICRFRKLLISRIQYFASDGQGMY